MGMHELPFSYSISGKPEGKQKKRAKYDDGLETFRAFEFGSFYVQNVSDIETIVVGAVKDRTTQNNILFYDDKFWIKDEYTVEDKGLRAACLNGVNDLDGGGSLSRDLKGKGFESSYRQRINRDVNDTNFKKVIENGRDDEIERVSRHVANNMIDIDGVLYSRVCEPVFELIVYEDGEKKPQAFVRLSLQYEKPRYKPHRFDDVFRFSFDKRNELEQVVDHIEHVLKVPVEFESDGEYFYGGEFQTFDDEGTNLLAAADNFVRETDWMQRWTTAKLTAWGELRDAFVPAKENPGSEKLLDQVVKKLDSYNQVETVNFHTQVAIYKWNSRVIDLELGVDVEEISDLQPMRI